MSQEINDCHINNLFSEHLLPEETKFNYIFATKQGFFSVKYFLLGFSGERICLLEIKINDYSEKSFQSYHYSEIENITIRSPYGTSAGRGIAHGNIGAIAEGLTMKKLSKIIIIQLKNGKKIKLLAPDYDYSIFKNQKFNLNQLKELDLNLLSKDKFRLFAYIPNSKQVKYKVIENIIKNSYSGKYGFVSQYYNVNQNKKKKPIQDLIKKIEKNEFNLTKTEYIDILTVSDYITPYIEISVSSSISDPNDESDIEFSFILDNNINNTIDLIKSIIADLHPEYLYFHTTWNDWLKRDDNRGEKKEYAFLVFNSNAKGPYWMTYYCNKIINQLGGKEELKKAPAWKIIELPEGMILISHQDAIDIDKEPKYSELENLNSFIEDLAAKYDSKPEQEQNADNSSSIATENDPCNDFFTETEEGDIYLDFSEEFLKELMFPEIYNDYCESGINFFDYLEQSFDLENIFRSLTEEEEENILLDPHNLKIYTEKVIQILDKENLPCIFSFKNDDDEFAQYVDEDSQKELIGGYDCCVLIKKNNGEKNVKNISDHQKIKIQEKGFTIIKKTIKETYIDEFKNMLRACEMGIKDNKSVYMDLSAL